MTVVILAIVCSVSVALNVFFALLLSQRSSQSLALLDRAHERTTTYTESLLDRLMAMDFGLFKAYERELEEAPEPIDEEPDIPLHVVGPDKGGFGSKLGLRALTNRRDYDEREQVRATEEMLESELPR